MISSGFFYHYIRTSALITQPPFPAAYERLLAFLYNTICISGFIDIILFLNNFFVADIFTSFFTQFGRIFNPDGELFNIITKLV